MSEPVCPYPPTEPSPPKDLIEIKTYIDLKYAHEYSINELVEQLPAGTGIDSLRVSRKGWDNGSECGSAVTVYYLTYKINEKFNEQLASYKKSKDYYEKQLSSWKDAVKQFLKDVDEYLAWAEKENYIIRKSHFEGLREKYSYLK
jgi:hypothetical protein